MKKIFFIFSLVLVVSESLAKVPPPRDPRLNSCQQVLEFLAKTKEVNIPFQKDKDDKVTPFQFEINTQKILGWEKSDYREKNYRYSEISKQKTRLAHFLDDDGKITKYVLSQEQCPPEKVCKKVVVTLDVETQNKDDCRVKRARYEVLVGRKLLPSVATESRTFFEEKICGEFEPYRGHGDQATKKFLQEKGPWLQDHLKENPTDLKPDRYLSYIEANCSTFKKFMEWPPTAPGSSGAGASSPPPPQAQ